MSWINSNATYKQNSKNDLSFYHGFSKTPVEPTSSGTAATTLANASTKGGHTVIGTEVWAEEIPWFGLVASRAAAVTRLSGLTKLNDLVKVDGEGGKVYKYIGADDATFTEAEWSNFWQEVTLTNGMVLNNRHNQPVLRYYLNQPMQTLTTTNNASIDSKGFATRLFVNEETHVGQTSGGAVVSQFAAGTDNIKNGIPSVELNPKLYLGTTEKIAGTHYYDYNVSGTILWSTAVTSSSPKISCFRYIGKTVTGQLSTVDETIKSHAIDISDIKATLGMESTNPDGTPSVTARVETVEDVVRVLLGLGDSDAIAATESIATTANSAATSAITSALAEGGSIAQAIADYVATNAKVSVNGQSATTITVAGTAEGAADLVKVVVTEDKTTENKIGLTLTATLDAAVLNEDGSIDKDGVVIATIAQDIAESVADTAITNAITTDKGAIKDAIAGAISDATLADGQKIATTTDTSKLVTVEDVTTYVSENAKVTLTQGTGITVTPNGEASTSFTVAVDDTVATKKSVDDLSGIVSKLPATIKAAQDAADAAMEEAQKKVASVSGPSTGLVTVTGDKDVTITVSDQIATKTDAATAAANAVTTGLATGGNIAQAIATAKSGAEQTAATALSTARGEITTEISTAVSGLETKLTTGEGSLGAKVAALETATGTTLPAAIEQALTDAKAYSDSLHTTSLDYVVLGDSESLPTASADTLGKIYLVASQNAPTADGAAISGSYVEYMTRKVGEGETATYTWEKIGTTAADLSGYAKSVKINGTTYTANAGALDLGTVVTSVSDSNHRYDWNGINFDGVVSSPIYTHIASDGTLKQAISVATDTLMGVSKMFFGDLSSTSSTTDATDTAVSVKSAQAMYSTLATLANSKISDVTASAYLSLAGFSITTGYSSDNARMISAEVVNSAVGSLQSAVNKTNPKTIEGGILTADGGTKRVIATDKIVDGTNMFASTQIETWVDDLSNMTNGTAMFKNCTQLTTFIGDLSSLQSADEMFYGCTLDAESLEILSENLPTVTIDLGTTGTIDIGASTNATADVIATIKGKGWTLKSNGTAI